MLLDLSIILVYFVVIMMIGVRGRLKKDVSAEEYFLSSRSLKWPYIAVSTIATNIQANHFIAMAGSAYVFGLAQANLEINAIFGILIATFIFVPIYLRMRIFTITQFFEFKLGPRIALAYSILMIILYSLLYLGTALFWAAYAIDGIFGEVLSIVRSAWVIAISFAMVALPTALSNGWKLQQDRLFIISSDFVAKFGILLAISLVVVHIIFH